MIELVGDLWEYEAECRCVTTNGVIGNQGLVMGKGVALEAKRRYPDLPFILGEWVEQYGNRAFYVREYKIITYPTKHSWRDYSSLELIETSALQVVEIANKYNIRSIALPRPGCGNGGLEWSDVKEVIKEILDDRFIILNTE